VPKRTLGIYDPSEKSTSVPRLSLLTVLSHSRREGGREEITRNKVDIYVHYNTITAKNLLP